MQTNHFFEPKLDGRRRRPLSLNEHVNCGSPIHRHREGFIHTVTGCDMKFTQAAIMEIPNEP